MNTFSTFEGKETTRYCREASANRMPAQMRLVFGVPARAGVELLATRSPVLGKGCAVWLWRYSTAGARLPEGTIGVLSCSSRRMGDNGCADCTGATDLRGWHSSVSGAGGAES